MGHGITNSPTGIVPGGLSQKIDLAKKSRLFSKGQKTSDHKSGKIKENGFFYFPEVQCDSLRNRKEIKAHDQKDEPN